jgi:hypothetical protein
VLHYLGAADGTNVISGSGYYLIGPNFQFTEAPAPPVLRIQWTRTNAVVLSWPTQAASFRLQATTNIRSWPTSSIPAPPTVLGTNSVLILPRSLPQTYFRLVH